jgi:hypothetical protein
MAEIVGYIVLSIFVMSLLGWTDVRVEFNPHDGTPVKTWCSTEKAHG